MVERPIKKSERQVQPTDNGSETPAAPPAKPTRSSGDRKKDRGKGKKGSKAEEPKAGVNLALMRGPRPTKLKPPVEEVPQEPEPTNSEDAIDSEAPSSEDSSDADSVSEGTVETAPES